MNAKQVFNDVIQHPVSKAARVAALALSLGGCYAHTIAENGAELVGISGPFGNITQVTGMNPQVVEANQIAAVRNSGDPHINNIGDTALCFAKDGTVLGTRNKLEADRRRAGITSAQPLDCGTRPATKRQPVAASTLRR